MPIEGFTIDTHPSTQAVTRWIIERQAALVHAPPGHLATDQQSRLGADPDDRPRLMPEFAGAGTADANLREDGIEGQIRAPDSSLTPEEGFFLGEERGE